MTQPGMLRKVTLVSGQEIEVQGEGEVRWFNATRDTYLKETKFTEATDLRDLDRLLVLELMVYRWTVHIASGKDYEGSLVEEDELQKQIKLYSDQITKVKAAMGMNKASRDAEQDQSSPAAYLANLKARAKAFGIHRENQLRKALVLMNELSTVVGTFDRADDEERRKIGFETETDVLDWVRETLLPEYRAVDEYFREHDQRFWARDI
jgi:hypothetical protein